MAVFHESDAATAGSRKISPILIAVIIAVVLCCCCLAVIAILVATGTITSSKIEDITSQNNYLPLYFSLRTWL